MKKKTPRKENAPHTAGRKEKQIRSHYADLSANAQRHRLLDALRCGSVTTLEARRNLEVLMPATRIFELRDLGYEIDTLRVIQETESGIKHSVARYVLMAEPKGDDHGH
jgi:Helix-turn-helix domain